MAHAKKPHMKEKKHHKEHLSMHDREMDKKNLMKGKKKEMKKGCK